MPYQSGQVSVGTTATLVCSVGSAPDTDGVLINSSAAAFIGGSGVTASAGFPVVANTRCLLPTTGAEPLACGAVALAHHGPQLAVVAHFRQVAGHLGSMFGYASPVGGGVFSASRASTRPRLGTARPGRARRTAPCLRAPPPRRPPT